MPADRDAVSLSAAERRVLGARRRGSWGARQRLPSLLSAFRTEGADAEPVVIGAHRRPEGIVLSYERYLRLLEGRERVRTILDVRAAAGIDMDHGEALRLAVSEQHAGRQ